MSAKQVKADANASTDTNSSVNISLSSSSSASIKNTSNNTEQPQTKRQKIETIKTKSKITAKAIASQTTSSSCGSSSKSPPSPSLAKQQQKQSTDIIDSNVCDAVETNGVSGKLMCSSLSSSAHSIATTPGSSNNSPLSTPSSSRATSFSQLLNVQSIANILSSSGAIPNVAAAASDAANESGATSGCSSTSNSSDQSADEVDRVPRTGLLSSSIPTVTNAKVSKLPQRSTCSASTEEESTLYADMREFEESLSKQCLCGVSEYTLRKPFQSHYYLDTNGQERVANLSDWPTNKLVQFLSNLQLLFDIYLKQNSKGFICTRIMDVCDALVRNDHNLIDEIIVLANYNNKYVQFLASRVLASFLVVAKQEMNDNWLKKLVDNLFNYERLDHVAAKKIHFSLEIIKRIVEWKDIDLHPLEDEISQVRPNAAALDTTMSTTTAPTSSNMVPVNGGLSEHAFLHFPTFQPTLETNYFAVHFRDPDEEPQNREEHGTTVHRNSTENADVRLQTHRPCDLPIMQMSNMPSYAMQSNGPESEFAAGNASINDYHPSSANSNASFFSPHYENFGFYPSSTSGTAAMLSGCQIIALTDSESFDTRHLKDITIKILENKWPALVENMSTLITNHLEIEKAENCILNFLELWENIISVKANLSIEKTLPFYAQLHKFEFLLNQNLSCIVYKQMLSLFNETLCYGSTLALQDMLPEETCMLAHQIVQHVKDYSILESLPRRQPENIVSLIGYKRKAVVYSDDSLESHLDNQPNSSGGPMSDGDVVEMDKTILQKMVLLVLKSIAVTVKEIRSDSSDSSIGSSDYDAFQDMMVIERSIRDVLRKLESFIKHTLEFHPECHFSKILIYLFDDQDDHLIEAMVCTLDVTAGLSFRNNAFPELVAMLNPVYTFLEFLKMISNGEDLLIDLLVSNETCFLLYLLRYLKYIRTNWSMFVQSCHDFGMADDVTLNEAMGVLIRLRLQISRLVSRQLFPYDISPVLRLLESCESLFEGNELS